MPSTSKSQASLMAAVAHGWHKPGGGGPSIKVAKDFNSADAGTGILGKPKHMADGGIGLANMEDPARLNPSFIRQQGSGWGANPFTHGLLNSAVPGRTDQLPTTVAANSHIIPADVIAGLGQGNTMAGANLMDHILKTGPWATTNMPMHHGANIPHPPAAFHPHAKKGGSEHKPTKIIAAGGEFVISPSEVAAIGGGDLDKGHKILDTMIKKVRTHTANVMLRLPGPKK